MSSTNEWSAVGGALQWPHNTGLYFQSTELEELITAGPNHEETLGSGSRQTGEASADRRAMKQKKVATHKQRFGETVRASDFSAMSL